MSTKIHELKTTPDFFEAVWEGRKPFEIRKNDRDFQLGDILLLKEWSMDGGYHGRILYMEITYILEGFQGLTPGYCILGIKPAP